MSDTIVRVAARGEGVTADGRHARLAAPGDTLLPDGAVLPGPHHRTPPCRHFPECGGCQLQHLDDVHYAAFVADRVSGALAAQGLAAPMRPPIVSPPRSRRRAVLQFESRGSKLGFSAAASHAVVALRECHILDPALFALVAPLRALLAASVAGRARVHLTALDQGIEVAIEGKVAEGLAATERIAAFGAAHALARLAVDDGLGPEVRWEPAPATITLGGVAVPFPPASFLQATRDGEAALVAAVREVVGAATRTADLFAGLGTFALALPGRVYAAEAARDAVAALRTGAARAGRTVFAEHRDLFRRPLSAEECGRFEAVVLDPPRAGARDQVAALAASRVPTIAYVSCNPSSFARDARTLCEAGYGLDWIQPVGQFLWSTEVELAARLVRQG